MVGERPAHQSEQSYEDMLATLAQTNRWVQIPPGLSPGWFRCPHGGPECVRPLSERLSTSRRGPRLVHLSCDLPAASLSRASRDFTDQGPPGQPRSPDARWEGAHLTAAARRGDLPAVEPTVPTCFARGPGCCDVTPMAVFLSASLNPSGFEIMSALAFTSALLRLTREETEHRFARWAWVIVAVSGFVLALSRTTGPVWIILSLAVTVPIAGARAFLTMTPQVETVVWGRLCSPSSWPFS